MRGVVALGMRASARMATCPPDARRPEPSPMTGEGWAAHGWCWCNDQKERQTARSGRHLTQAWQTEAPHLSTGAASTQLEGLRLSWHVIGQSWPGAGLTVAAVLGALAVPCATRG